MKPFDNFKSIERFRRHVENDDFMMSHTSEEYGTVTYNYKRYMSAALFYKEYVREYGWEFCEKAAAESRSISPTFLHFCHFYEWNERDEFETYLCQNGADDRFNSLKQYVPLFNENDLREFIQSNLNSNTIEEDTLLLYGWLTENYHWDEVSLASMERCIIDDFRKRKTSSSNFLSKVRRITNAAIGIKPQESIIEEKEGTDIKLDDRGKLAISLVKSGANLFITGKAGTGKTTLLKEILSQLDKKVAVVAPTGVAAKNAVGITIHSFLRLPVTPYFPGIKNTELYQLKKTDEQVIKRVEIIIIDEISMVRCDLLDAMDDVLRHYRKNSKPFGGIQVVMFGDLFQLMPVAPNEEWEKLKKYYESPYFFSSKVYQNLNCQMLELKKVYRQNENDFITILNNIREGIASYQELDILNTRYDGKASIKAKDSIMLTTHNRRAKGYNWDRLQKLQGDIQEYKASVSGWFPSEEYPTSYTLQLKVGAKIMFVKNDTVDHAYYNGMMGVVTKMGIGYVEVEAEGRELFVTPQYWEHQRYIINKETNKLEVEVTGSFVQLPLMLAWAVTIHKSQGLTFDKVLIDAERAFTFGQVYVALSRCRTLKGILLATRLTEKCIKADDVVKKFMAETKRVEVIDENENVSHRKHLTFKEPEDRTLFFINNGLGIDEIVKQCGQTKAIILSHIAKLVAKGKVEAKDFVLASDYVIIESLFQKYGVHADRKMIRIHAPQVSFGEIEIVRAQLSKSQAVPKGPIIQKEAVLSVPKDHTQLPIVLNVSPKTFEKIEKNKKKSYKKIIYKPEEAKIFFVEDKVKLSDVDGTCPYTLKEYRHVQFSCTEPQKSLIKTVVSITVEASEVSSENRRWVVTIEFK